MITHDARRSLSRGNNPVPSPWLATARTGHAEISRAESAFRANPAPAGRTESITLCDGRRGTDVGPEFRERAHWAARQPGSATATRSVP
jgi:hypothetical protein